MRKQNSHNTHTHTGTYMCMHMHMCTHTHTPHTGTCRDGHRQASARHTHSCPYKPPPIQVVSSHQPHPPGSPLQQSLLLRSGGDLGWGPGSLSLLAWCLPQRIYPLWTSVSLVTKVEIIIIITRTLVLERGCMASQAGSRCSVKAH